MTLSVTTVYLFSFHKNNIHFQGCIIPVESSICVYKQKLIICIQIWAKASVSQWLCHWPCKPGAAGSMRSFSSLSDETINRDPVSMCTLIAVGGMLNPKSTNQPTNVNRM